MTRFELKKKLKLLSRTADGGQVDFVWQQQAKAALLSQITAQHTVTTATPVEETVWQRVIGSLTASMQQLVAQPSAIAGLALVVVLSGAATVSASLGAVPGDFLYNIKIGAEETQLFLTTSATNKARLKIDFAGRRVTELTQIIGDDSASDDEREHKINTIVSKFTKDVSQAKGNLQTAKEQSLSSDVVDVAKEVDAKASVYEKTLKSMKDNLPPSVVAAVSNSINQAARAAAQTSHSAVEVLIVASQDGEAVAGAAVSPAEVAARLDHEIKDAKLDLAATSQVVADASSAAEKISVTSASTTQAFIATSTNQVIQTSAQAESLITEAQTFLDTGNLSDAFNKIVAGTESVDQAQDQAASAVQVLQSATTGPTVPATSTDPSLHPQPSSGGTPGAARTTTSPVNSS